MTDQLPENGFPSGISTPSITVLILLLLNAGLCVVLLDGRGSGTVSAAITESQEQLVRDAGSAIGASASQGIADLRAVTAVPAATPDELLTRLLQSGNWRGAAVLDARTRALVASRGEPVATQSLPPTVNGTTVTPIVGADGTLRLVVADALPDARLLVAARGSRLPNATTGGDEREALLLTTSTGQVIDSRGTPPDRADTDVNRLVQLASTAAAAGEKGNLTGRTVTGPKGDTEQPAVVYTPVSSSQVNGTLGLAVVSVVRAPVTAAGPGGGGIVPALALGGAALFGFLLVRLVLVRPIRRLRADALAIAGGRLMKTRVRRSTTREVYRIAAALEHCRSDLGGEPARLGKRRRLGMPIWLATGLTAATVLGWSVGLLVTAGSRDVTVPDAVVTSLRNQTTVATEALRRSLNDGLADLTSLASLADGDDDVDVRSSLDELIARQSRYRSVYLVDESGRATSVAGRQPLRTTERLPAEPVLSLRRGNAPVPVLFASTPLPNGQALVGEFDLDHITRLLNRAPGSVQLVDNGLRTIASTDGFIAFADLSVELRDSAIKSGEGRPVASKQESRSVIVSAPLRGGASGELGWKIVAEQPVTDLALPENELRRNAMVAALVAVLLALLLFGWQYLLLIRPLRRVAAAADEIVAGRYKSVIYPQNQDQIGTIASCLEICRQAMTEGVRRLGGVRRPTGAATDVTEMFAAVPAAPPKPSPKPSPKVPAKEPRRGRGQATRKAKSPAPSPARRGR